MQNLGAGRQTKCIVDSWKLEKCKVKVIRRDGMGCIRKGRDGREEKGGEGRGGKINLFIYHHNQIHIPELFPFFPFVGITTVC